MALVRMVRNAARQSGGHFERLHHEWSLVPEDRLKLKFSSPASPKSNVRVSINVPPDVFSGEASQWIKQGRWDGWSIIHVQHRKQLLVLRDILHLVCSMETSPPPGS